MIRWILAAVITAGLTGCAVNTPTPIYVGHVSDKTRNDKAGDHAELGIRLALAELSKDDALANSLGGRPVHVRHTDTRGDLDAFESEAIRLVNINKCIALFGGNSAREVDKLDRAQAPLLTFFGYPVVGAGNQVFYLGMMPTQQGEVLARAVAQEAATTRVVILLDEGRADSAARAVSFQKTWPTARLPENPKADVFVLRFSKDAKWPDLVEQMKTQSPHAVVFAGGVQDFNAWHKVYCRLSTWAPQLLIYAGDEGDDRAFELDPSFHVLLATSLSADPANQKVAAFAKAYQEAFQTQADVHAALAYDGFRLFAEALKRTTPTSSLRDELQKTKDFDGVTGSLTITADRQVQRPLHLVRWQNGKLTAVKTPEREGAKERAVKPIAALGGSR